jgi:hypothetical protein
MYGQGMYFLITQEEYILRVSENRELRKISGYKKQEVTGGFKQLHAEALHNLQRILLQ